MEEISNIAYAESRLLKQLKEVFSYIWLAGQAKYSQTYDAIE